MCLEWGTLEETVAAKPRQTGTLRTFCIGKGSAIDYCDLLFAVSLCGGRNGNYGNQQCMRFQWTNRKSRLGPHGRRLGRPHL